MHNRFQIQKFINLDSSLSVYEEPPMGPTGFGTDWRTPKEIKAYLDLHVIGQHEAKKVLATSIFNRGLRLINRDTAVDGISIDKSNVLMLGPTGCGKTFLIETLAKYLNIPYISDDATRFTSSGYIGGDILDILERLIYDATKISPHDGVESTMEYAARIKELAETGIIYIDEIDKLARGSKESKGVGDVEVQEELLKIIEGSLIQLNQVRHSQKADSPVADLKINEIDTTNILFIVGGSFYGIESLISSRVEKSGMGFTAKVFTQNKNRNILHKIMHEDLVKFGMIPEFLGRFPIHVAFNSLTQKDLISIMTDTHNSLIAQTVRLFKLYGREIVFSKRALKRVSELALRSRTGARGLKRILDATLRDIMFEAPSDKFGPIIKINADMIKE